MFLSQAHRLPGLHVLGIADLSVERARQALHRTEWRQERFAATSFAQALETGSTFLTDDGESLIQADGLNIVVEATGNPVAGIRHALKAFENGRHVVMVNVEADALAGPLLAKRATEAGVIYSLAYGDQPALICELVEWAQINGFEVVCAGKGTRYLPIYHTSTPDTVWEHYGFGHETVAQGDFNARMFNSFLDGTKSAVEMAAVSNATGLLPQPEGLLFPPCGIDGLPNVCRPLSDGGLLTHKGTVEVVSSLERDGRPVDRDLRWGVYVTFEAPNDYVRRCFAEYGMLTDSTGWYTAMYRPYHLIGLELIVSILKVGLRGEATGCPVGFIADVIATAKRHLSAGEVLDGEGGYTVYGALMSAEDAMKADTLPIGLAHNVRLKNEVVAGQPVHWSDVEYDETDPLVRFRHEMEYLTTHTSEKR
ncbi:MAG: flagellar biosynthesis protein FlgA [Candidatus Latescibacteria bacterium]|nr:flagellar biosynthesis protein FlgA [Candidatus Latescibacterota bacterium]